MNKETMKVDEFIRSTKEENEPPSGLSLTLQALWWDATDDWQKAHEIVQSDPSPNASWVHAYLHRREGDESNAAYWYSRAGKPVEKGSFVTEREHIASILLGA